MNNWKSELYGMLVKYAVTLRDKTTGKTYTYDTVMNFVHDIEETAHEILCAECPSWLETISVDFKEILIF